MATSWACLRMTRESGGSRCRAYYEYGRYLVELMRLPSRSLDDVASLTPTLDIDEVRRLLEEAPGGGGMILAVGHVGSNEAVAAGIARHGLPLSVVADDSSFPELFDLLRRQREGWGVKLIGWRNLRGIFGVLRRREMLGLLVDWGYRSDGIPVRLFGAWTALPAGPATLAAKTGSRILPITIRRQPDDTMLVTWPEPIDLESGDPAELWRATQALADWLAGNIAGAPHQWYSFKPIWPATAAEACRPGAPSARDAGGPSRPGARPRLRGRGGRPVSGGAPAGEAAS